MRPRGARFDWVSIWLLLSAFLALFGIPFSEIHWRPSERGFVAAYWVVSVGSLVTSGLVALRRSYLRGERELRRRRIGFCTSCGYDLRATPGRCPECGTVPLASARL